jgi:hypothetical protein
VLLTGLGPIVAQLTQFVQHLAAADPKLIRLGIVAGIAVAALGPLLTILGNIGTAIAALLSPIGLLLIAIAAVGAFGIQHFGSLDNLLRQAAISMAKLSLIAAHNLTPDIQNLAFVWANNLRPAIVNATGAATAFVQGPLRQWLIDTAANVEKLRLSLQNLIDTLSRAKNLASMATTPGPDMTGATSIGKVAPPSQGGLGGLLSSIFGGFRAEGGGVSAGQTYVVGERGPELLHMGGNGSVSPTT